MPHICIGGRGRQGTWSGEVGCVSGGICPEVLGEQKERLSL